MVYFDLFDYPKFKDHYNQHRVYTVKTWTEQLRDSGYKSTEYHWGNSVGRFSMNDKDFTMFTLRWT